MKSLPSKVLESIYFRGILPSSTYGIAVWGSCSPALMEVLERVHRRAAQIIHKIPTACPDSEILKTAKWKSVAYMYKRRVTCLTHEAYYERCPDVINKLIEKHTINRDLRDNMKIELSRCKTNFGRASFRHRPSIIWNALPEDVKKYDNYMTFKKHLKRYSRVLDNISFNKTATVTHKDTDVFYYS